MQPAIIEVAINGITPVSRNRHAPRLPSDIARTAIACLEMGAGIIHNHIDDLKTTGESAARRYAEAWSEILARHPEAVLCPTGTIAATAAEQSAHFAPCAAAGASMAPLDPGSLNICDTDSRGLPGPSRFAYTNDFDHIEQTIAMLAEARLGPSVAIYEPSFLRAVLAYHYAGMLPSGTLLKFYFGGPYDLLGSAPHRDQQTRAVGFGLPPTPKALDAYLEMLGDTKLPWAVACLGGDLCDGDLARHALDRGGHLRVGLEDYGGTDEPSNQHLLEQALDLCRKAGRPPATSAQTAAILELSVNETKGSKAFQAARRGVFSE